LRLAEPDPEAPQTLGARAKAFFSRLQKYLG